jgi:hypothetical protein
MKSIFLRKLTFFAVAPMFAIAIGYAASPGKPQNFDRERYGVASFASLIAGSLLFSYAKHRNADIIYGGCTLGLYPQT